MTRNPQSKDERKRHPADIRQAKCASPVFLQRARGTLHFFTVAASPVLALSNHAPGSLVDGMRFPPRCRTAVVPSGPAPVFPLLSTRRSTGRIERRSGVVTETERTLARAGEEGALGGSKASGL